MKNLLVAAVLGALLVFGLVGCGQPADADSKIPGVSAKCVTTEDLVPVTVVFIDPPDGGGGIGETSMDNFPQSHMITREFESSDSLADVLDWVYALVGEGEIVSITIEP